MTTHSTTLNIGLLFALALMFILSFSPSHAVSVTDIIMDSASPAVFVEAQSYVNFPPRARQDFETTPKNTPIQINSLENDDAGVDTLGVLENQEIIITSNTQPSNGTVTVTDGVFTYTPNDSFVGTDTFEYTITDQPAPSLIPGTSTAIVTIEVTNQPPVALNDEATTTPNSPVTIDILENDFDVDGEINPATVRVIDAPAKGSLIFDTISNLINYVPDPALFPETGTDTFTYEVLDDSGAVSNSAIVTITVAVPSAQPSVNTNPVFTQNTPEVSTQPQKAPSHQPLIRSGGAAVPVQEVSLGVFALLSLTALKKVFKRNIK